MLTIGSMSGDQVYCNLSSWYVRPDFRKYSALLMQRTVKTRDVIYTDCSPADHVLPIVTKFGFRPYTGGTLLIDARAALRRSPARITSLTEQDLADLPADRHERIARHLSYGCCGLALHLPGRPAPLPLLYRTTRLKRLVPAARFLFGAPEVLADHAGPLSRALLARGIPLMLLDLPEGMTPATGRVLPGYGLRYVKGAPPPETGDLTETEIALFGF